MFLFINIILSATKLQAASFTICDQISGCHNLMPRTVHQTRLASLGFLLLGNCVTLQLPETPSSLHNVLIEFLPPNTTSRIWSLSPGIIASENSEFVAYFYFAFSDPSTKDRKQFISYTCWPQRENSHQMKGVSDCWRKNCVLRFLMEWTSWTVAEDQSENKGEICTQIECLAIVYCESFKCIEMDAFLNLSEKDEVVEFLVQCFLHGTRFIRSCNWCSSWFWSWGRSLSERWEFLKCGRGA